MSHEKGDGLYEKMEGLSLVQCHKTCYNSYTSRSINSSQVAKATSSVNLTSKRLCRSDVSSVFDFKMDCLICVEECKILDEKHRDRWVKWRLCLTIDRPGKQSFRTGFLKINGKGREEWSRLVENRIHGAHSDIPEAKARHHDICYQKFKNIPAGGILESKGIEPALGKVIYFMKGNPTKTRTISELFDLYTMNEGTLTRKQMMAQLNSFFGDEMLVLHIEGHSAIVGIDKFVAKSHKIEKQSQGDRNKETRNSVSSIKNEISSLPGKKRL